MLPLENLRVLHFGHFDPHYARNRVVRKALQRSGACVTTVTSRQGLLYRVSHLARQGLRDRSDVVLVGSMCHGDVPLAAILGKLRRRPVIFDPLISLYEASVEDRRVTNAHSLKALRYLLEDVIACRLPRAVLVDTDAHRDYFAGRLKVPIDRLKTVWVGADDELLHPFPKSETGRFEVFLYASFIPLHGVEHVVTAAHALERAREDVHFTVAGDGQTRVAIDELCRRLGIGNMSFVGYRTLNALIDHIAESDLCLGIFGTTQKAARVIPHKVVDALAMRKAVVTGDTPAIREALSHGESVWLCERGNGDALAEAIMRLKRDPSLRAKIAEGGYGRFQEAFSIDAVGRALTNVIREVCP